MLWLFIAAAGAGVLVGLALLRVLPVFAASVALGVSGVVWMLHGQWPVLGAIVYAFMLLATFQCSYLVGLIFSSPCKEAASQEEAEPAIKVGLRSSVGIGGRSTAMVPNDASIRTGYKSETMTPRRRILDPGR